MYTHLLLKMIRCTGVGTITEQSKLQTRLIYEDFSSSYYNLTITHWNFCFYSMSGTGSPQILRLLTILLAVKWYRHFLKWLEKITIWIINDTVVHFPIGLNDTNTGGCTWFQCKHATSHAMIVLWLIARTSAKRWHTEKMTLIYLIHCCFYWRNLFLNPL